MSYSDPYIPKIESSAGSLESVKLNSENLSAADCIVIATDHSCFDLEQVAACSKLVFDTRGVTRKLKGHSNIARLGENDRYL
jgi:UDP-N-acetyl-D-glucosamine dehydrogenase